MDSSITGSFNDVISNYEEQIINSPVNVTYSDDVSLNDWELVYGRIFLFR
jgi:hypothetical protein